jgi:hypothetical protein
VGGLRPMAYGRTSVGGLWEDFGRWLARSKNRTETHLRDDSRVKREGKERCASGEKPSAQVRSYSLSQMILSKEYFSSWNHSALYFFEPNTIKIKMKRLRLNPKGTLKKKLKTRGGGGRSSNTPRHARTKPQSRI